MQFELLASAIAHSGVERLTQNPAGTEGKQRQDQRSDEQETNLE
ncbi:MAG TPA: hypothetical protein VM553_05325 [Dongiaceae bacterium]|nr:hypothetical protein [Dongiaceae bacterium]